MKIMIEYLSSRFKVYENRTITDTECYEIMLAKILGEFYTRGLQVMQIYRIKIEGDVDVRRA